MGKKQNRYITFLKKNKFQRGSMNGISQSFDCDNVSVGGGHFQSDSSSFTPSYSSDYSSNIIVGGGHNQYDPNGYLGNRVESVYDRSTQQSSTSGWVIPRSSPLGRIMTIGDNTETLEGPCCNIGPEVSRIERGHIGDIERPIQMPEVFSESEAASEQF